MFIKGMLIGLSIAAPVGPIGVLCIRRSVTFGPLAGFVCGLGAAVADATYGAVAAFGLTFVSGFLVRQQGWLGFCGSLFLCYLGARTFLAKASERTGGVESKTLITTFLSTCFLTLTNPMTILAFVAVFAGLGLAAAAGNYWNASLMVVGVFAGSALWWLFLSITTGFLRKKLTARSMEWINKASGVMILGFGFWGLIVAVRHGFELSTTTANSPLL